MILILTLAIALTTCSAIPITYNDCTKGSHLVTLNEISIGSCSKEPCTAHPGSNFNIHVNFTAHETITAGQTTLKAKLLGLSFPIPLPSNDICQTITCPVQSGQTVVFDYAIPVPAFTPQITVTAEWKVTDQNNKVAVCMTTSMKVHS